MFYCLGFIFVHGFFYTILADFFYSFFWRFGWGMSVSILLAWVFLDQTPTINQITSSTLIVIAGILSVKKDKNNIIPP